jgi:hypothetical protein
MVPIDLTPRAVRDARIGRTRMVELCATTLAAATVAVLCVVVLKALARTDGVTALRAMQGEVASLEQQVRREAEERQQARRNHERNLTREAQRQLIPTVLDLISKGANKSVSLSKLHITSREAILEGCAEDAHAISQFLESLASRCPSIQTSVNKVHTVLIAGQSVESFSARLSVSFESLGVSLCREEI